MQMVEASIEFMDSARRLISKDLGYVPTVGNRRGAIVLAYYAVFHRLAELCAEEIVGSRSDNVKSSQAWNEYYRSLEHSTVRQACLAAYSSKKFSSVAMIFCQWFPILLDARELCSYEAHVEPTFEETLLVLLTAEECVASLANIEENDRKDFVAWMILKSTGGVQKRRSKNFRNDSSFFAAFNKQS